jgi:prophage antirepressor-like protein
MMVTELGLYNLLSQSKKPMARKWRRVIHSNLILLRRDAKLNIEEQFREWDLMADNLFIDEETGELMEFNTVAGGDVEVRPYVENK